MAAVPEAEPAEPTTREILGDFQPLDRYPDLPGVQYAYDELGNFIPDLGQPDPGHADTLKDSNESDHIDAGGGNDLIAARRGGADWIELGAGDDWADGGAGADRIAGGAGRDILEGSDDDDTLEGGDDPDLLGGGSGDDFLYARALRSPWPRPSRPRRAICSTVATATTGSSAMPATTSSPVAPGAT